MSDAPRLSELAVAAYGHYVQRMGMVPRPMTDNYADVIEHREVAAVEIEGVVVGMLVLATTGVRPPIPR